MSSVPSHALARGDRNELGGACTDWLTPYRAVNGDKATNSTRMANTKTLWLH